jgi:membrane-bound ClpP family serine protease
MEIFVNPNVSYVLLIVGFLIGVLALFAPGTGILELLALAVLFLAGYGIANLPVNWWAFFIMLLAFVPILAALRLKNKSRRKILVVLSTLLFVIGSAFLFDGEGWRPAVNPLLILFMSTLAIGTTWFFATKTLQAMTTQPSFNLDNLIGMTGQASSDIRGQGTVYVNGEEWTATSNTFIRSGDPVRVVKRSGLALEVEPVQS